MRVHSRLFCNTKVVPRAHDKVVVEVPYHPDASLAVGMAAVSYSDIAGMRRLYQGPMSSVYEGEWRSSRVAVKVVRGSSDAKAAATLQAELAVLRELRHPRVLMLMGVCTDVPPSEGSVALILEHCANGSLHAVLHDFNHPHKLSRLSDKLRVCHDMADGMCFLHRSNLMHRDMKSPNVLVDGSGRAKIADFGLSKFMELSMTHVTGLTATPMWTAPEVLLGGEYHKSADVYSYGVVLWEVFTEQAPWANMTLEQIITAVWKNRSLALPSVSATFPEAVRELVRDCFGAAADRPTFAQAKERLEVVIKAWVNSEGVRNDMTCPITMGVMADPVVCADGYTYERAAITEWLQNRNTSPKTNQPLAHKHLFPTSP